MKNQQTPIIFSVLTYTKALVVIFITSFGASPAASAGLAEDDPSSALSIEEAVRLAHQAHEPRLQALQARAHSEKDDAVAASSLPDPRLSVGVLNLPLDDFDYDREPITQALLLSFRQSFPRGDTRRLSAEAKRLKAGEWTAEKDFYDAKRIRDTRLAWLRASHSLEARSYLVDLIHLLSGLKDQQEASFASAGSAALQRLYRTELELALIEDRLDATKQDEQTARALLARFIGPAAGRPLRPLPIALIAIPDLALLEGLLIENPALQSAQARFEQADAQIALAKQAYKPAFDIEARYGWREGARSDLGSIFIGFDLPFWTSKRQDPALSAAKSRAQAAELEEQALKQDLLSEALAERAILQRLQERLDRFDSKTIARAEEAAEASQSAYGAGDIDFAELVRAETALVDTKLQALTLRRDLYISAARLQFLLGDDILGKSVSPREISRAAPRIKESAAPAGAPPYFEKRDRAAPTRSPSPQYPPVPEMDQSHD